MNRHLKLLFFWSPFSAFWWSKHSIFIIMEIKFFLNPQGGGRGGNVYIYLIWECLFHRDIPANVRSSTKYFFCYDNVCNLSNMKLWREPLPIRNFQNIWTENLIKIIDSLHMHNHKRESCHTTFNPAILKKELPNSNTMICEQTFRDGNLWVVVIVKSWVNLMTWFMIGCSILCSQSGVCLLTQLLTITIQLINFHPWMFSWLGRFKKILNTLPKHRFEFMLHRLILHRNRYTEYCHQNKKYPHLPSVKANRKKSVGTCLESISCPVSWYLD